MLHNSQSLSAALLELTCPLDSNHHIKSARARKQRKTEYLQLLAEFDRLNVTNYYDTIEITVLGHYQVSSIKNLLNLLKFVHPDIDSPKSAVKNWLDDAAFASISASQRILRQETVRSGTQTNDRLFYSSFLYCNSYFFLPCHAHGVILLW